MLSLIFKPLSLLPLSVTHWLGACLGRILFYTMRQAKQRAFENMSQSGLFPEQAREAVQQHFLSLGKAMMETPFIWNNDNQKVTRLVQKIVGWEGVETAIKAKKGIIFIAPHMGCFEIISRYFSLYQPITVLFRAPKQKWLIPLMKLGRLRDNIDLAEANTNGVRKLLKTLKKGETIGILPDQVPATGEGEWVDFFNKPAYTMTLASKLAKKTGATVVMVFGERLPKGAGYAIHFNKLDDHAIDTPMLLNNAIETLIKQCPSQYLWSYHRYKIRRKSRAKLNEKQS